MKANESQGGGLTPKQERAIEALLSEPTTKKAAETAKISEVTIYRWLNDPLFTLTYKAARGRLTEATLTALQSTSALAVETLRTVMADVTAQASARVGAAKTVLELGLKAREILETEERLKAIEERLKAMPQGAKL